MAKASTTSTGEIVIYEQTRGTECSGADSSGRGE